MDKGSQLDKSLGLDLNGMVYVFKGELDIAGKAVSDGSLALLSNGTSVNLKATDDSEFLILAGPEIGEPIARYGPFVMNTREEIMQAIEDYQNGVLA
jgi:redox-sensitive bicupin YhaK (pirin superfamily)